MTCNSQTKIRKADENDFQEILVLIQEFAEFQKIPDKMTNSVSLMKNEKDHFHCFIAETPDKQLVGYVIFFFAYFSWTGKSLYMDDLYIQEAYRGNGIGKQFMQAVENFAKETNCKKIRWQVSGWNEPAINFYKNMGAVVDDVELTCDLMITP